MRAAWRDIKTVAGRENVVVNAVTSADTTREDADVKAWDELGVLFSLGQGFIRVAPSARASGLQQEDRVVVNMRANASAIVCVGRHDVVDAPIRNEGKVRKQVGNNWHVPIDLVNEQSPRIVVRTTVCRENFLRERA
jgi:hypothetical protein